MPERIFQFLYMLLLVFPASSIAQQRACVFVEWSKHYGGSMQEVANAMQPTTDGGFIVAGYSRSQSGEVGDNFGKADYWVVKLDSLGTMQWQKNFGGSDNDIASSVLQTSDGGYIVAGGAVSFDGQVGGNHGNEDAWILRLDAAGNLLWAKTYGGSLNDRAESISPASDGGFIVAGYTESKDGDLEENQGDFDYWAFKIDGGGNLQWSRNYGGAQADFCFDAKQTADGGYILVGSTFSGNGDVSLNKGFYDYWIVRLDAQGNLFWEKSYGGTGEERAYSVILTAAGEIVVAGTTNSSGYDIPGNNGSYDYWIIKLAEDGNLIWSRTFGGSNEERSLAMTPSLDGGLLIAGFAASANGNLLNNYGSRDGWLLKLDAEGQIIWEKNFGGSKDDRIHAVSQLADGGFVCAGFSTSNDFDLPGNYGEQDMWVIRLSPDTLSIFLGNDTTLCAGEGLLLAPGGDGLSFLWLDSSTLSVFLIDSPGVFWVEADKDGCKLRDTIEVSYVSETPVSLGQDTILCEGETLLLDPGIPDAAILWKGGSSEPVLPVTLPGSYWVSVAKDGCEYRDTISVSFTAVDFDLGGDAFLCEGQSLVFELNLPNASYLWQDNSAESKYVVAEPGEYILRVTQGGCQRSDTVLVSFQAAPIALLPVVSLICEGEGVWLDASQPEAGSYVWQDGSTAPKFKAVTPGSYQVEVNINGCLFRDELELKSCETCLYIPSAFSPNGDGINDLFQTFPDCPILSYKLLVFDRWGTLAYEAYSPDEAWDGRIKGRKANVGTYIYRIELEVLNGDRNLTLVRQGTVALLR